MSEDSGGSWSRRAACTGLRPALPSHGPVLPAWLKQERRGQTWQLVALWMFCASRGIARMPSVKMLSTKLLLSWRVLGSETEAG